MARKAKKSLRKIVKNKPKKGHRKLELLRDSFDIHAAHELFEKQADKNPLHIALDFDGQTLTYSELDKRSNQMAHYLKELGVTKNSFVALVMDRSIDMVVAILSTMKAGGAYVPVDPESPKERLQFLLDDIEPALVITHKNFSANIKDRHVFNIESDWEKIVSKKFTDRLECLNTIQDTAYMIYTSGSTGLPKGCLNSHRGLINYIQALSSKFTLNSSDRYLFKSAVAFDVSVQEIFWPLLSGGTCVIAIPNGHKDIHYLLKTIHDKSITTIEFVPSMLQIFIEEDVTQYCRSLKTVFVGGEALPLETAKRFFQVLPDVKLINAYGPTEAVVGVTYWECKADDTMIPIGNALPNNKIYILDVQGKQVPQGASGELCIGGAQVAKGYWKRPELTAEKFVRDPFSKDSDARIYKTGDRARVLPNGALEFQGRVDFQVKIRGMRIELGEIEAVLFAHPLVSQASVVAKKLHGPEGAESLVGYVIAKDNKSLEISDIKEFLGRKLSAYMVPPHIFQLDSLPLNSSGKVDRKALMSRTDEVVSENAYIPPEGKTEIAVAKIWEQLLKVKPIGRTDNFFLLGGNSILSIQVIMRLQREVKIEVPLRRLFENPKLKDFCRQIDEVLNSDARSHHFSIPKVLRTQFLELSFAQERLWIAEQLERGQAHYYVCDGLRFNGDLNVNALERALTKLVDRHEILRVRFKDFDGVPGQEFLKTKGFQVGREDLTYLKDAGLIEEELKKKISKETKTPFDLEQGELIRAYIYRLKSDEHFLLFNLHHIISDDWSIGVLYRELSILYNSYANGQEPKIENLPIQYADYAVWQKQLYKGTEVLEKEITFWREHLKGAPEKINLATDFPRPEIRNATTGQCKNVIFDKALMNAIREFSEQNGVTTYITLFTVFSLFLSRYSGQKDLVVGSPMANRDHPDVDGLIGFFVNTLALRMDMRANPTLGELLQHVKETTLLAYEHQGLPFEKLVQAINPSRDPGSTPIFQVMFNYLIDKTNDCNFQGLTVVNEKPDYNVALFDLALDISEEIDGATATWTYDTKLFAAATIDKIVRLFDGFLRTCLSNADQKIDSLGLGEEARQDISGESRSVLEKAPAVPDKKDRQSPSMDKIERTIANAWEEVLRRGSIGRDDNFFVLGGDSLGLLRVMQKLRSENLGLEVKDFYGKSTIATLADLVRKRQTSQEAQHKVPLNQIPHRCDRITPEMLPLVKLSQDEIDRITKQIPGGAKNVQDIYPLAPLQEGILFHHMMEQAGDTYIGMGIYSFDTRERLDRYLDAFQSVVSRHDALRTAFFSEGLREPIQVVCREAKLLIEEITLNTHGDPVQQLRERFSLQNYRIDIRQAPVLRIYATYDASNSRWLMVELLHHLIMDHESQEILQKELAAILSGQDKQLSPPLQFREFVAESQLNMKTESHDKFFRDMLKDVSEPTLPFGLSEVSVEVSKTKKISVGIQANVSQRARQIARKHGVSAAGLFHVTFGRVLATLSGCRDVVFGTVLFGRSRLREDSGPAMGLYMNTLPVKLVVGEKSVHDSVVAIHEYLAELTHHEAASLTRALQCSSVPSGTPLFTALLNYRHNSMNSIGPTGLVGMDCIAEDERTNYPFSMDVDDNGESFALTLQVHESASPDRVANMMLKAFDELVLALEQTPEKPIRTLDILPQEDRDHLLEKIAGPIAQFKKCNAVQELFERQVDLTPDHIALDYEGQTLTYRDLDQRSNQLAHYLREKGVERNTFVIMLMDRSIDSFVSALGILKAGGAFAPLNPEDPEERLKTVIEDVGPQVILTRDEHRNKISQFPNVLSVNSDWKKIASSQSTDRLKCINEPGDASYMIFTSGSTGKPKGTHNTHEGLANFLHAFSAMGALNGEDKFLFKAAVIFDVSVQEMLWPLVSGAQIVIAMPEGHKDPRYLAKTIQEKSVTATGFVPSMLQLFLESNPGSCPSLRMVIAIGEAVKTKTVKDFYHRFPNAKLINSYGPAEAAIAVTYWECRPNDEIVPIGYPLANNKIYILDESRQLVPQGVFGTLYIGGIQVAKGYWNRPDLTLERFVKDTFAKGTEARMYNTGDRARFLPNGTLEYQGRVDFQVKIRGIRVELGEVESVLLEYPGVHQAAAVVKKLQGPSGTDSMVAYLVCRESQTIDTVELKEFLKKKLPEYMVPTLLVQLESLPLIASGKVNRQVLKNRVDEMTVQKTYIPPEGKIETSVARIWEELLNVKSIGREDQFFNLGGHSILAIHVIMRLQRDFQVDVPLRTLFQYPILKDFSEQFASLLNWGHKLGQFPMTPVSRDAPLELSFAQERLWILDRLEPGQTQYSIYDALRLSGDLNLKALEKAVIHLVNRHEILRVRIKSVNGIPRQEFVEKDQFRVLFEDLSPLKNKDLIEQKLREKISNETDRPFSLSGDDLIRAYVYRLTNDEHMLLINVHHIVSDHWSMNILYEELSSFYNSYANEQEPRDTRLRIQYPDYGIWQREIFKRTDLLEKEISYWRENLKGAPENTNLPTDFPRPAIRKGVGRCKNMTFDPPFMKALREFSEKNNVTPYTTLLTAFNIFLSRYSGQTDIVVGSPVTNREHPDVENVIGFFVNTLALRTTLEDDLTVDEALKRVKENALSAYEHQNLPFEKLVEVINPARDLSTTPIFQVMFNYLIDKPEGRKFNGLTISIEPLEYQTAQFDLSLNIFEGPNDANVAWVYDTALFSDATVERMARHFEYLLKQCLNEPIQKIRSLRLLSDEENQNILVKSGGKTEVFEPSNGVHELFERQVDQMPNQIALEFEDQTLTYLEVDRRSNQLAHYLREKGVTRNKCVSVLMDRSIDLFIALVGILKAGGVYVPQNPEDPSDRVHDILNDVGPQVILTHSEHVDKVNATNVLCFDRDWDQFVAPKPDKRLTHINKPDDASYMIFTSGSTGKPKGTHNTHEGLANFLCAFTAMNPLTPDDKFLFKAAVIFDVSVHEMLWPLVSGARVVIAIADGHRDPYYLAKTIQEKSVTVTGFVPSMLQMFLESRPGPCRSLRIVIAMGEALKTKTVKDFYKIFPKAKLTNSYGPAEAAVAVTYWECRPSDDIIPIGYPLANNKIYILDENRQLVPQGVYGTLYIGGVQVAKGYWNRPDLTAERFVKDPFAKDLHARMYNTGDRARYLPNGTLEYQGRVDFQVKIRGMRVELGEVESVLFEHPTIHQAAALAKKLHGPEGGYSIVAYLVPKEGKSLDIPSIKEFLNKKLPVYMVPAHFINLASMPLNTSGKVDRQVLKNRVDEIVIEETYFTPEGALETSLAKIWEDLLNVKPVGREDNFFNLGGHSLLGIQIATRVQKEFNIEVPIRTLFQYPTFKDFSRQIEEILNSGSKVDHAPISKVSRENPLELSFGQERMWMLHQLEPESANYSIPNCIRIKGPLDMNALEKSFLNIIDRHETLKSKFTVIGGVPKQEILDTSKFRVEYEDLRGFKSRANNIVQKRMEEDIKKPFDLSAGNLIQMKVYQIDLQEYVLFINMHHIVSDFWSQNIFNKELEFLYNEYVVGKVPKVNTPEVQYGDFAHWQRELFEKTDVLKKELEYWETKLKDAPSRLELPTDFARPVVKGSSGKTKEFTMSEGLLKELKEFSEKNNVTMNMALISAFKVLLMKYSGQTDIVVGSPVAGRMRQDLEGTIGFFVNTLVLRTDISGNPTFAEVLNRVKHVTLEAYSHQNIPFEKLVEVLNPKRDTGSTPLFQVMFNYLTDTSNDHDFTLKGLNVSPESVANHFSQFDLTLDILEHKDSLSMAWEYDTSLFEDDTIAQMSEHFKNLMIELLRNPERKMSDLKMLSEGEMKSIVEKIAGTDVEFQKCNGIHELFEYQADKLPTQNAVEFADEILTYRELDERSNQLAHYLQKNGVTRNSFVGILMDRSIDMVVAILGTIKAGGAYVPIDPELPNDRIIFSIEDMEPCLVITHKNFGSNIKNLGKRIFNIETDWTSTVEPLSKERLKCINRPEDTAYMIYTSGSTGQPKGCLNTHQGIANYIQSLNERVCLGSKDRCLFKASVGFDVSAQEIFWPLIVGATCVIARPGGHKDVGYLLQTIETKKITAAEFVPSMLQVFLEEDIKKHCQSLKVVTVGGETLPKEVGRKLLQTLPFVRLIDCYGPTETAVGVTSYEWSPKRDLNSIGRPLSNNKIYILDEFGAPVPIGVFGELYIGGTQVSKGYWKRHDLTNEKFIKNTFFKNPQARMYKTGDRGRFLRDGNIEFQGRTDFQVKLRGYRIELGEIETALLENQKISQAAVILKTLDKTDKSQHLIAYLTTKTKEDFTAELREQLRQKLPEYMVPTTFLTLEEMPTTTNGKLDRKALMNRSDVLISPSKEKILPKGEIEIALARIWENVLDVRPIYRDDNFFDIGGHSLAVIQMVYKVKKEIGRNLEVATVFGSPTLKELAQKLNRRQNERHQETIVVANKGENIPPIFLVPALDGDMASYASLIRQFEKNRPVWGLQAHGMLGIKRQINVEEMAMIYLREITHRYKNGPLLLLGWSFGGIIANEMAIQASRNGQEVTFLGLIDTFAESHRSKLERFDWHGVFKKGIGVQNLLDHELLEKLTAREKDTAAKILLEGFQKHEHDADTEIIQHYVQFFNTANVAQLKAFFNNLIASDSYTLKQAFMGQISLFAAKDSLKESPRNPTFGWNKFTTHKPTVQEIPGNHYSILRDPNAKILAQEIEKSIKTSIRRNELFKKVS